MSAEDWYRSKTWNHRIEEEFFSRLARARSQRDQYIVIQALTIATSAPESALKLVDLYFGSKKNDFHDVRALSAKANAYRALSQRDKTLLAMKEVLSVERKKPSHKTTMYVEYPYFVAIQKIETEYKSALETLKERVGDLMFPLDIFKWHASKSLMCFELQEKEISRKHAGLALDAAQIKKSGFRFHQKLGLVGKEHKDTIEKLRKIYA
jgi:hypothetical protein